MTITYPLTLPTHTGISSVELRAVNAVSYNMSPFTFSGQAQKYSGEMWQADISLPPMKEDDAEEWLAWLVSLSGQYGTFLLGNPARSAPRGAGGGTPLVAGAGQTGATLNIDGASVSVTGWLKAGDYIQVGTGTSSRLHKVLQDVNTSGTGTATLDVWPSIKTAPADNSAVVINGAKGLFRLTSNEQSWSVNSASIYGVTFGAMSVA